MASKKNLTKEAYERQIAGLNPPWKRYDRDTAKSPVRLYQDQDDRLAAYAESTGKTKAEVAREAVDFFLQFLDCDRPNDSPNQAA